MYGRTILTQYGKMQDGVVSSARSLWLAGLGAFATAEQQTNSVFDTLVGRGRDYEAKRLEDIQRVRRTVGARVDDVSQRVDRGFGQALHMIGVPFREEIESLTRRVEALTTQVEKLARMPAPTPAAGQQEPVRKVYHVSTHEDGWKVEAEGASRATSVHPTKDEAVSAAKELAQHQAPSQVVVHKIDGAIQANFTYDPESATS
jgi:poly(hydroxyalkanoate) granule-associated protein